METVVEKNKIKLNKYVETLEQLGANARFYNNCDDYDRLHVQFKSIEYWAKKAAKVIEDTQRKLKKGDN